MNDKLYMCSNNVLQAYSPGRTSIFTENNNLL